MMRVSTTQVKSMKLLLEVAQIMVSVPITIIILHCLEETGFDCCNYWNTNYLMTIIPIMLINYLQFALFNAIIHYITMMPIFHLHNADMQKVGNQVLGPFWKKIWTFFFRNGSFKDAFVNILFWS